MKIIGSAAMQKDFGPQGLVNMMWAAAKVSFRGPLMASLSSRALQRMAEMSSVDLANVAWCYGTTAALDEALLAG